MHALAGCQLHYSEVPEECLIHEPGQFFLGRCHEKAIEYLGLWYKQQGREGRAKLVQGETWRFCDGRFLEGHSWVEIYDYIVFEPVLQKFYAKNCYENIKVSRVHIKLSYNIILKMIENYGIDYYPSRDGFLRLLNHMQER